MVYMMPSGRVVNKSLSFVIINIINHHCRFINFMSPSIYYNHEIIMFGSKYQKILFVFPFADFSFIFILLSYDFTCSQFCFHHIWELFFLFDLRILTKCVCRWIRVSKSKMLVYQLSVYIEFYLYPVVCSLVL